MSEAVKESLLYRPTIAPVLCLTASLPGLMSSGRGRMDAARAAVFFACVGICGGLGPHRNACDPSVGVLLKASVCGHYTHLRASISTFAEERP